MVMCSIIFSLVVGASAYTQYFSKKPYKKKSGLTKSENL